MTGAGAVGAVASAGSRLSAAVRLAVRAARWRIAAYLGITLVAAALPVLTAWLTRAVVNAIAYPALPGPIGWWTAGLVGVGLLAGAVPAAGKYLHNEVERAVGDVAKRTLFGAVNGAVGVARFEDPTFLNRLHLADESAGRGPSQVMDGLLGAARAGLTVGGLLAALCAVSPPMALTVAISGLPVLAAELLLGRRRARAYWEVTPAERREISYRNLLGSEQAAKEVRLFGLGGFIRDRMLAERRAANTAQRRVDRTELAVQSVLGLLAAGVGGAGLLWAVAATRSGALRVGDVAMFIAGVVGVQAALAAFAQEVARAHQALLMFGHYLRITGAGPELPVRRPPRALRPLRRGVELRGVWFRYAEDQPHVLRGLDLVVPHGRTVALVGLNGCGKSTIVKLLCRFYDPCEGAVLWDGTDLRDVAPEALRDRVSAVFQDFVTYEMTAAENVGVGDLTLLGDRDRIRGAAVRAGVHRTLARLPRGYDTLLGRQFDRPASDGPASDGPASDGPASDGPVAGGSAWGATALSGGQRQRLALARAFLREGRDLMILDEPSSGLDPEAEHEIHVGLSACRAGMTSVLVSHRLAAVRRADLIVCLDGGRVVEQGDHEALIAAGGRYAELFELQAAGYRAGTRP